MRASPFGSSFGRFRCERCARGVRWRLPWSGAVRPGPSGPAWVGCKRYARRGCGVVPVATLLASYTRSAATGGWGLTERGGRCVFRCRRRGESPRRTTYFRA